MLKKLIKECEIVPKGYGISWALPSTRTYVCYPYGLHLLFGWVHEIYFQFTVYPKNPKWVHREEWKKDMLMANQNGYRRGQEDFVQDLSKKQLQQLRLMVDTQLSILNVQ